MVKILMGNPYLSGGLLTLYEGDCRRMTEVEDNSVHCVVTSPPYLSKRIYKTEPLIWDGQTDCPHEWGDEIIRQDRGALHGANAQAGNTLAGVSGTTTPQGQFCRLCGAWRGHLGLEPSPDLYIQHLIGIFREVRRVLRPDGCLFVNLGDTHAGGGNNRGSSPDNLSDKQLSNRGAHGGPMEEATPIPNGLHPGDLIGIPWRFALAMQQDGWRLRQDIIWHKPAPMPESVNGVRWEECMVKVRPGRTAKRNGERVQQRRDGVSYLDTHNNAEWQHCPGCPKCTPNDGLVLRRGNWRPTVAHEYIFMFTKSDRYYADREAVRKPKTMESMLRETKWWNGNEKRDYPTGKQNSLSQYFNKASLDEVQPGRNLRSVWTIGPEPFSGAHFATYPTELPSICIKASTSERGVCPRCGSPYARVMKVRPNTFCVRIRDAKAGRATAEEGYKASAEEIANYGGSDLPNETITLGWRPTCSCAACDPIPATVLDPFAGTFATGEAAVKLGRRVVGYELSPEYCRLAVERNRQGGMV